MKNCLNCNNEFEPNHGKAKFCSAKCRVAYSRKEVKQSNTPETFDSDKITITGDEPLKFKKPEKWVQDIRKYCLENNILPEDLITYHSNSSKIIKKSLSNDSKTIKEIKIINSDAQRIKQVIEPVKGSNAYFLRYGKWD